MAPVRDYALTAAAQEHGFRVREVRLEFERAVSGHPSAHDGLRLGEPSDLSLLAPIALGRFRGTRFFADNGFPAARSAELYLEWLRRGLNDAARRTLVAEDAPGFVVCHFDKVRSVGRIELIAVSADATQRGVGGMLLAGAGAMFESEALRSATVATQASNVAAQRLYQRNGYLTIDASLCLHRWTVSSPNRAATLRP